MLLDTNAYTAIMLNKPQVVELIKSAHEIMLPIPVIAELKQGFILGSQLQRNEQYFADFLSQQQVIIANPVLETARIYADISSYCRKRGRVLSHNDLWIAALAIEHDTRLVTYDRDFMALSDRLGDKLVLLDD